VGDIYKMSERSRLIETPDMVHPLHGIAAMGGYKAVQEIVFPAESQVETAPGKRASHWLDAGVRLVYGRALTALDAVGHHIKCSDDLIRHEAAKVAYDLLARIVQLPGAVAPFGVKLLQLTDSCLYYCVLPLGCIPVVSEIPGGPSSLFRRLENSAGLKSIADDKMTDLSGL